MKQGQILLELLLALGVAVLTLVALLQVTTRSVSNARFSQSQSVATPYAVEAMEWLRRQRNSDWNAFVARSGQTYCLATLGWNVAGNCPPIGASGFVRQATLRTLSATSPQQIEAVVTVTWPEASKSFAAEQTTIFTQY